MAKKIQKEQFVGFTKEAGKLVSSCSIQMLVCGITRAVLPSQVGLFIKGGALIGGLLLGGFVSNQMEGFVEDKVDEAFQEFDETKKNFHAAKDDINRLKELMKEQTKEELG